MSLMQTRAFGRRSRLQVSALGLGCMGMSEFYGMRDDNQAIATIRHTPDMYGIGHNEELLGRAVRDTRDHLVIATKFGVVCGADGAFLGLNRRPDYVRSTCEASLVPGFQPGEASREHWRSCHGRRPCRTRPSVRPECRRRDPLFGIRDAGP